MVAEQERAALAWRQELERVEREREAAQMRHEVEQAEEAHQLIRGLISELFSSSTAEKVIIQYGGSVKPDNAKELLSQPNIDGALVGGACLKTDSFAAIINAAS